MSESKLQSSSERSKSLESKNRDDDGEGDEETDLCFLNKIGDCPKGVPCGLVYEKFCEVKDGTGISTGVLKLLPVPLASVSIVGTIVGSCISRTKIVQLYRNLTKESVNVTYLAYYDSQLGEMFSFKTEESVYNEFSKTTEIVDPERKIYVGKMIPIQVNSTEKRKRKSSLSNIDIDSMLNQEDPNPNCIKIKLGVLQPGRGLTIKIAFMSEVVKELGKGAFHYTIPNTFVPRFKVHESTLNNEYYKANNTFRNVTEVVPVIIYNVVSVQGVIKYVSSSKNEVIEVSEYTYSDHYINTYVTRLTTMADTQSVEDFRINFSYRPFITPCVYREDFGGVFSHLIEYDMPNIATKKCDYEIIFFLDLSSSMSGTQYGLAKKALMMLVSDILPSLASQDRDSGDCYFNICGFGNKVIKFNPCSLLARDKGNIDRAVAFIKDCSPELGEVDLLEALNTMLESVQSERFKSMIIITEGWLLKNFEGIQELVKIYVDTRFHMIGVGSNISKYGITSIARDGRGQAIFYKSQFQNIKDNLRDIIELALSFEQFGTANSAMYVMEDGSEVDESITNFIQLKEFPSTRSFGGCMTSCNITTCQFQKFIYSATKLSSGQFKQYEAEVNPNYDYSKIELISKYCKMLQLRTLEVELERYEYFEENNESTRDAAAQIREKLIEISMAEGFPSSLTVMKPHYVEENGSCEQTLIEKDIWKIQSGLSFPCPCPKLRPVIKSKRSLESHSVSQDAQDDAHQSVNVEVNEENLSEVEPEIRPSNENQSVQNVVEIKVDKLDVDDVAQSKSEEKATVQIPKNKTKKKKKVARNVLKESEEISKRDVPEPKVKKVKFSDSDNEPLSQASESKAVAMKKNCLTLLYKLQNGDGNFVCDEEFCEVFGSTKEELLKERKRNCNANAWATILALTYAKMCVLDTSKIAGLREKAQSWIEKNIPPEKVHSIEEAAKEFIYKKLN